MSHREPGVLQSLVCFGGVIAIVSFGLLRLQIDHRPPRRSCCLGFAVSKGGPAQAEKGIHGVRLSPAVGEAGDWFTNASLMDPIFARAESLGVDRRDSRTRRGDLALRSGCRPLFGRSRAIAALHQAE